MSRGVGQGRREGQLAEAHAAEGLLGIAKEVGSGADILLVGQNRRLSKDYERLCASAEAFVYAAMIRLMVRRLVRA